MIEIDNAEFMVNVFHGLNPDTETIGVCAFPDPPDERDAGGGGWRLSHPASAEVKHRIGSRANENNTYFCISTVTPQQPLNRKHSSLVKTYVIPLDDVGTGPGAKIKPSEVPLEPTYAVETSPNNFQYGYVLATPTQDRAAAQALIKCMTETHGDGGAPIAAKYMRLPVGINNKTKYDALHHVRLTIWEPDRRFTLEELEEAFSVDPLALEQERARVDKQRVNVERGLIDESDRLVAWLGHHDMLQDPHLDSEGWLKITCPWAHKHTDGNDWASYSPIGAGGEYRDARQFNCFHDHCKDKTIADVKNWVISQGGPNLDDPLLKYLDRYVYCASEETVVDRYAPAEGWSLTSFHNMQLNDRYFEDGKPKYRSREWMTHPGRTTVKRRVFAPGRPRVYDDLIEGGLVFNTYTAPTHVHTTNEDKLAPILEQLQMLFGDQYEHALSWLACTVHRPEQRIKYALLHISPEQGTGRGWLKELMQGLLQQGRYVQTPSIKGFMDSDFNGWLKESLLVVFDEVYAAGNRFKVQDRLREMITEDRILINQKYGSQQTATVCANMMFLSNHLNAMAIPKADRRMWVVICDAPPLDDEASDRVYDAIRDGETLAQFYWYLKRHDEASEFNPTSRAPRTAAFDLVTVQGEDDLQRTVGELVDKLRMIGATCIYRKHLDQMLLQELPDLDLVECRSRIPLILNELGVADIDHYVRLSNVDRLHLPGIGVGARTKVLAVRDVVHWRRNKGEAKQAASQLLASPGWSLKVIPPDSSPSPGSAPASEGDPLPNSPTSPPSEPDQ